jgi:hypothetical protein
MLISSTLIDLTPVNYIIQGKVYNTTTSHARKTEVNGREDEERAKDPMKGSGHDHIRRLHAARKMGWV